MWRGRFGRRAWRKQRDTGKGYRTVNGTIVQVAKPTGKILKSSNIVPEGEYVVQGYNKDGKPSFTDRWSPRKGDTVTRFLNATQISILQGRMKARRASGSRLYKNSDCKSPSITHKLNGTFTAKSSCRGAGRTITFDYQGKVHEDGFTISVARTLQGKPDKKLSELINTEFQIIAHKDLTK